MKILFSVFLFAILFAGFSGLHEVNATVYYISATGNDLSTGTSPSEPWQTITKMNTVVPSLLPGDQILFKKGDTFYGNLIISKSGTLGNEIIIGSYGSGNLPIITGRKIITGWTLFSGNVYRAPVTDSVYMLYCSKKLMTIARFPNTGFLKVNSNSGNSAIYSNSLTQSAGYWNGANIRIRTANWSYETKVVSNFSGGVVTYNSPTQYTATANYGFYFDNKSNLLDVENEWFRNYSDGYVYLYAPGGVNPNGITVEGMVVREGIKINQNRHFIKIRDIEFDCFANMGVFVFTSNNITVTDCIFKRTLNNGVGINGQNIIMNNNYFEDNINNAMYGLLINGGEMKNNVFKRTGLHPGYGSNGRGYMGMELHVAQNIIVESNTFDSTGYSAITVGKNAIVRKNYVNNSLLYLNDGAGIDISDADTMIIQENVVLNTEGNVESSGNPSRYGSGIYINAAAFKNSVIENNTSANNTYCGIYFDHKNNPVNNRITGNVLYNNQTMQMLLADYSAGVNIPVYNTIIKNNTFYSLSASQPCLVLRTYTGSGYNVYGTFDSNYYCSPYTDYSIQKTKFTSPFTENIYSLQNWQNNSGNDLNSKSSLFQFSQYGITDTLSGNMVSNGQFDSTISPWVSWPSGMSSSWVNHPKLNGGSNKLTWNGTGYTLGFSISSTYSITAGQTYIVSFQASGLHNGTFSLWGLSSISSSTFSFPQKFFSYDTSKSVYSFSYIAPFTDPAAKLSINLTLPDTVVFVDNIEHFRVNVEKIDSTMLSKFFYNETGTMKSISLNGIPYKDIDGNPINGNLLLLPYSSKILINENFIPSRNLLLKVLMEGFYNNSQNKLISDSIRVNIRNAVSPFDIIESKILMVDSTGSGSYNFNNAKNSINYYLSVEHRNSIETWSSTPVIFNNNILSYDFTTSAGKAFGNNQILSGSKYCIFSGNVNEDESIELSDVLQVFNAAGNFSLGYVIDDVTGDNVVDLSDISITYNNSSNFVLTIKP